MELDQHDGKKVITKINFWVNYYFKLSSKQVKVTDKTHLKLIFNNNNNNRNRNNNYNEEHISNHCCMSLC